MFSVTSADFGDASNVKIHVFTALQEGEAVSAEDFSFVVLTDAISGPC